jgi:hypothetical protein
MILAPLKRFNIIRHSSTFSAIYSTNHSHNSQQKITGNIRLHFIETASKSDKIPMQGPKWGDLRPSRDNSTPIDNFDNFMKVYVEYRKG